MICMTLLMTTQELPSFLTMCMPCNACSLAPWVLRVLGQQSLCTRACVCLKLCCGHCRATYQHRWLAACVV